MCSTKHKTTDTKQQQGPEQTHINMDAHLWKRVHCNRHGITHNTHTIVNIVHTCFLNLLILSPPCRNSRWALIRILDKRGALFYRVLYFIPSCLSNDASCIRVTYEYSESGWSWWIISFIAPLKVKPWFLPWPKISRREYSRTPRAFKLTFSTWKNRRP